MWPTYFEIEPTRGCNLKCRMCHVSFMHEPLSYLDLDRIRDFSFLKGATVSLGAVFEPCVHPQINRLIDILNQQECGIVLITNGHNLHRRGIPALFDSRLEMVTFSFDGISAETYELVRVGGRFARTLDNIESFRTALSKSDAVFALNFTVLRCNLHEVAAAAAFWNARDFDVLRYIAMTIRNDDRFLTENALWDVRTEYYRALEEAARYVTSENARISITSPYFESPAAKTRWNEARNGIISSQHPGARRPRLYPREYQFGADFGMSFPCKSPFVAARVLWDGTVMLCHDQPVGNLYEAPFAEIWHGTRGTNHRARVRNQHSLCERCDYFRLCLNSHFMDLEDIDTHYSQSMLDRRHPVRALLKQVSRLLR